MQAWKRQAQRREEKRQIAVIKAVQKAGLPVRRATIEGVDLEFGPPASEAKADHEPPPSIEPRPRALFKTRTKPKIKVVL
jgi:hypothetical protein